MNHAEVLPTTAWVSVEEEYLGYIIFRSWWVCVMFPLFIFNVGFSPYISCCENDIFSNLNLFLGSGQLRSLAGRGRGKVLVWSSGLSFLNLLLSLLWIFVWSGCSSVFFVLTCFSEFFSVPNVSVSFSDVFLYAVFAHPGYWPVFFYSLCYYRFFSACDFALIMCVVCSSLVFLSFLTGFWYNMLVIYIISFYFKHTAFFTKPVC